MTQTQLVKGSLAAIATEAHTSLAETFVNAECVVLVDTSGSMSSADAPGGRTRYDQACTELESLQATLPGKIAVISFSNHALFCPDGRPMFLKGLTNLAGALDYARIADVPGIRFIVISDGQPDSEADALTAARKYRNRIDTIYVGPEDRGAGREFLTRLAHASGGQATFAAQAAGMAMEARRLLTTA